MAVSGEDFARLQSQVQEIKLLLESGQHTIPGTMSTAPVQAQTLNYLQLAKQVQVQEEQAAQTRNIADAAVGQITTQLQDHNTSIEMLRR